MNEIEARGILAQQRIERDITDPRSCAQIVGELSLSDVPVTPTESNEVELPIRRERGIYFVLHPEAY